MKNSKGFTLIELLAVITIMGILLFVGVPAIMKTINNSKKDTAEVSVKRYANEVDKEIKSYEIDNGEVKDGSYSIMKNGNLCLAVYDKDSDSCSGEILSVDLEGQKPEDGTVKIVDKKVAEVSNAKIDRFYVNSGPSSSDFVVSNTPTIVASSLCSTTGDVSYNTGTLYTCEVATGVKYDFRILSVDGNKVNLLMTQNLPGVVSSYFNWGTGNGANYNNCGPVQAYDALANATSGWNKLKDIDFEFRFVDIQISFDSGSNFYGLMSKDPKCDDHARWYDKPLKARLANYSEISALSSDWYAEGTTEYAFESGGYWLNEPYTRDGNIWTATAVGSPHGGAEEVMWSLGIRPVIQVLKADLG